MLAGVGAKLEMLDLNGGLMSSLTDEALTSVVRHCPNLTRLYVNMHRYITGVSLLPLLEEPQRAGKMVCLNLSCKFVRDLLTTLSRADVSK